MPYGAMSDGARRLTCEVAGCSGDSIVKYRDMALCSAHIDHLQAALKSQGMTIQTFTGNPRELMQSAAADKQAIEIGRNE